MRDCASKACSKPEKKGAFVSLRAKRYRQRQLIRRSLKRKLSLIRVREARVPIEEQPTRLPLQEQWERATRRFPEGDRGSCLLWWQACRLHRTRSKSLLGRA